VQLTSADVCRITFEKCIPHITNFTTAIDVEGHELMVLRGALNTIERNNPVICIEQNDATERWGKGKEFEALDFLKDIGYTVVDTRKHDYIMVRK